MELHCFRFACCAVFSSVACWGWPLGSTPTLGGVAMLLVSVVSDRLQRAGKLLPPSRTGIVFWSSIYIPIVVAMAASQNVRAALTGGPAAILAGVLVFIVSFAMVPVISVIGQSRNGDNLSFGDDEAASLRCD